MQFPATAASDPRPPAAGCTAGVQLPAHRRVRPSPPAAGCTAGVQLPPPPRQTPRPQRPGAPLRLSGLLPRGALHLPVATCACLNIARRNLSVSGYPRHSSPKVVGWNRPPQPHSRAARPRRRVAEPQRRPGPRTAPSLRPPTVFLPQRASLPASLLLAATDRAASSRQRHPRHRCPSSRRRPLDRCATALLTSRSTAGRSCPALEPSRLFERQSVAATPAATDAQRPASPPPPSDPATGTSPCEGCRQAEHDTAKAPLFHVKPAPGSRLPAPGSRLPAPGSRLPAPSGGRCRHPDFHSGAWWAAMGRPCTVGISTRSAASANRVPPAPQL